MASILIPPYNLDPRRILLTTFFMTIAVVLFYPIIVFIIIPNYGFELGIVSYLGYLVVVALLVRLWSMEQKWEK